MSIKITQCIVINAPAATAFDYTQDYTQRLSWDTFLRQADLLNGAKQAGIGVTAYCRARNGFSMETVYVTFNRPKVTAITMTKGPWFIKTFSGSWIFKALSDEQTKVSFTYLLTLRSPFNGLGFFIKNRFTRNVRQRLTDLRKCLDEICLNFPK